MTLGLASGLSKAAWMMVPEAARAAPASRAASTRGRRTLARMARAASVTSPPVAQAASSGRLTEEEPSIKPRAVAASSRTTAASSTAMLWARPNTGAYFCP